MDDSISLVERDELTLTLIYEATEAVADFVRGSTYELFVAINTIKK